MDGHGKRLLQLAFYREPHHRSVVSFVVFLFVVKKVNEFAGQMSRCVHFIVQQSLGIQSINMCLPKKE